MVLHLSGPNRHWSLACRCKIPAENFIALGLLPDCRLQAGQNKPMILLATMVWIPASWRPSSNRCGKWRAAKGWQQPVAIFLASLSPISSSFTSLMSPYLTIDKVSTFLKLQSPGAWLSADIERKIQFSLTHTVYSTGRTPEQLMATITKPKILVPAPTIHFPPHWLNYLRPVVAKEWEEFFWLINFLR